MPANPRNIDDIDLFAYLITLTIEQLRSHARLRNNIGCINKGLLSVSRQEKQSPAPNSWMVKFYTLFPDDDRLNIVIQISDHTLIGLDLPDQKIIEWNYFSGIESRLSQKRCVALLYIRR
jgi:hypothetical protein